MYINLKMFKLFKIFAFLIIFLFFSLSYTFSSELIKKIEIKGNERIPTATVLMFADFKINNDELWLKGHSLMNGYINKELMTFKEDYLIINNKY